MGSTSDPHFRRSAILDKLGLDDKKLFDKFLNRLNDLGVIVPDGESGPGCYQFANRLHHCYFLIEAQEEQRRTFKGFLSILL
jgi:hypothetical protein